MTEFTALTVLSYFGSTTTADAELSVEIPKPPTLRPAVSIEVGQPDVLHADLALEHAKVELSQVTRGFVLVVDSVAFFKCRVV